MQFINNFQTNLRQDGLSRKRWFAIGIVVLLFGVLVLFTIRRSQQSTQGISGDHYDPASQETVSNPADKSPESFGTNPTPSSQPVYLGLSKLLDFGVSTDQIDGFKLALHRYAANSKEFSVYVDTLKTVPNDRDSATKQSMTFDISIDRKDRRQATLEYYDLSAVQLHIKDSTGKTLYDSGEINITSAEDGQGGGD